jgi:hypothetical protein
VTFSAQNIDRGSRGSEGGVRRNLRVQSSCEVMKVVRGEGVLGGVLNRGWRRNGGRGPA